MKLLQRMTRRTVAANRVLYIDQEHALAFQTCGSDMCWNNYCRLREIAKLGSIHQFSCIVGLVAISRHEKSKDRAMRALSSCSASVWHGVMSEILPIHGGENWITAASATSTPSSYTGSSSFPV